MPDTIYQITDDLKKKITDISPLAIPLNATAQGWQGAMVRRYLAKFILDDTDGLIAVLNRIFSNYNSKLDNYSLEYSGSTVKYEVVANVDITKGQLLASCGKSGNLLKVEPASVSGVHNISINPEYIIGIALENINVGENGFAVSNGYLVGVNTKNIPEESIIYPDFENPGEITSIKPTGYVTQPKVGLCVVSDEFLGIVLISSNNFSSSGSFMKVLTEEEAQTQVIDGEVYFEKEI